MNQDIIVMKDISKVYKMGSVEFVALKNINFTVKKGEFAAIIGPSGAGKSTLMNIIGCLDTPSTGEYVLDGLNTNCNDNKLAEIRNKKIGFIFQTFNLLPKLNILENVELPLHYLGMDSKIARKKALEQLDKVGLSSHLKHRPSELSGGQKQRVAIARALVTNPQIILADEPTGALDSKTGHDILNMLKELNSEGNTIVLITHDMGIASYSKRIVKVMDGQIISDEINNKMNAEVIA